MQDKEDIPAFNTLKELIESGFGTHENIFFSNKKDWSKIIIMFNGAIFGRKDIDIDTPIFHRWSWHKNFKHPLICISDPLTYGKDALPLAWYQGSSKENYLNDVIGRIKIALNEFNPSEKEFVSFGSSGGGFASLLCAHLGLVETSIAINPQTNIYNFSEKRTLNLFLKKRIDLGLNENHGNYCLIKTGFSLFKETTKIIYIQNTCDIDHYNNHMTPYITELLRSKKSGFLNLHCFTNEEMGHNPPPLHRIARISGETLSSLLA